MDSHTFAVLHSVVADLEELFDLVEGGRLEVLDGDEVDGEALDGGGGRRHLGRQADQVRHLVVVVIMIIHDVADDRGGFANRG